jgi:hypothetical protein
MIDEFSKVRAQTIEAVDNAGAAIDSDGGEVIRYRYDASQRASSQSNGRGFGPGQ